MEGAKALYIDDEVRVKVALLPVGNTSLSHFERFAGALAGITEVELGELDLDTLPSSSSTAFPCKTGVWAGSTLRIGYADSILQASPWDTLQASRQVMAVVGVCCCADNMDLMRAWESFLIEVQHSHVLRSSLAVHCLAFNPIQGQEHGMVGGPWGNTLHCITGSDPAGMSTQIRAVLKQVAGEVVHGLEQLIVTAEGYLPNLITPNDGGDAKDPKVRLKRGPGRVCKRQADLCLLAGCPQDAILRYRMSVEISRSCGDHLWLAAALEGLAAAVSLADPALSAASTDVLTASLSSLSLSTTSLTEMSRKVPQASVSLSRNLSLSTSGGGGGGNALVADPSDKVGECLLEAAALYDKRKAQVLQSEALLRYARHLCRSAGVLRGQAGGGGGGGGGWKEVWLVLAKVETLVASLQAADQVMVWGAMAKLCEDLQCRRKVAYYVYQAARTHVHCNQWALAHDSMLLVAAHCRLPAAELEPSRTVAGFLEPQAQGLWLGGRMGAFAQEERTRRVGRGGSGRGGAGEGGGWFSLQATIVADLMHCSQMLGDDARAARYYSFWLSRIASPSHSCPWLLNGGGAEAEAPAAVRQRILLNQLLYRSSVFLGSLPLPAPGGPILRSISIHIPPHASRVIANPDKRGGTSAGGRGKSVHGKNADVFLYCAFAEKEGHEDAGGDRDGFPFVVAGEVVKVRLLVENPFHVALPIEYLSIMTDEEGGECGAQGSRAGPERAGKDASDLSSDGVGNLPRTRRECGALRLVPTSVELPPRPASPHVDVAVHNEASSAKSRDASRGARSKASRQGHWAHEVILEAVVLAPPGGFRHRRESGKREAAGEAGVGRLRGCKIRLWNVIFEIEALSSRPPVPQRDKTSSTVKEIEYCSRRRGGGAEYQQSLYKALPDVALLSIRCNPTGLPREMATGEVFRGCLLVENSGSVPIAWFRIAPSFTYTDCAHDRDAAAGGDAEGVGDLRDSVRVVVYDASELQASLPLAPGAKAQVPLWICPPPLPVDHNGGGGMEGHDVTVGLKILYGKAEDDDFWRGSEWSASTKVVPSLTIRSIRLVPCNPSDFSTKLRAKRLASKGQGGMPAAVGDGVQDGRGSSEAQRAVSVQHGVDCERVRAEILPGFVTNESYAYSQPREGVSTVCLDESWAGAHESTLEFTISNHSMLPYFLFCGGEVAADGCESRRDARAETGTSVGESEGGGLWIVRSNNGIEVERCIAIVDGRSTMRVRVPFARFELSGNDAEESVPVEWLPEVGHRALSYEERKAAAAQAYAGRYCHALISRLCLWWARAARGGGWMRGRGGILGDWHSVFEGGSGLLDGGREHAHAYGLLFWDGCTLSRDAVRHIQAPIIWIRGRIMSGTEGGVSSDVGGESGDVLTVGDLVRVEVVAVNLSQEVRSCLTLQIREGSASCTWDDAARGHFQLSGNSPSMPGDGERADEPLIRVAFSGVLDNALPRLLPGATHRTELKMCVLEPGYVSLSARVCDHEGASLAQGIILHVMAA